MANSHISLINELYNLLLSFTCVEKKCLHFLKGSLLTETKKQKL